MRRPTLLTVIALSFSTTACFILPDVLGGPESHDDPPSGSTSAMIGVAGGKITTPEGVEVEVPAGALDKDTLISVTPTSQAPDATVGPSFLLGPEGQQFKLPVTITIPYDSSVVSSEDIQVLTAPKDSADFTGLGGWTVDETHVRAYTTHFSAFVAGYPGAEVVAASETYPSTIATDGTTLFYATTGNARHRVTNTGALVDLQNGGVAPTDGPADWAILMQKTLTPTRGDSTPLSPTVQDPRGMAVDPTYMFYTVGGHESTTTNPAATGGKIVRVTRATGAQATLASAQFPTPIDLLKNASGAATAVLYADWQTGKVLRVGIGGGSVTTIADTQGVAPFVTVVGNFVYWTSRDNGTVMRRALTGSTPAETLVTGALSPEGITADDTYVYYGTLGASEGQGGLWRATLPVGATPAGTPEKLRSVKHPRQLLVKGAWVTATDQEGTIYQVNRTTGLVRTRALGQIVPTMLAADSTYVYWTNLGDSGRGSITRMANERCSVEECGKQGMGCSPSTGLCIPAASCPALPPNSRDFFVDATSIAGGNGTQACPFKTIKSALAAANASTATSGKSIRVGVGTYSAATGETFPIELRGISLIGSGGNNAVPTARTVIEGEAAVNRASAGGYFKSSYKTTLVIGDTTNTAKISSLVIQPGATVTGGYGIICDRGTATTQADGGAPPVNTTLDDLVVGPTFDVGILATNSTNPAASGCNFVLTRSSVVDNTTGLFAAGCDGLSTLPHVAAQIGSTNAAYGNSFISGDATAYAGFGVRIGDCVDRGTVYRNTFDGDDTGLFIRQTPTANAATYVPAFFDVQYNTIKNSRKFGVLLSRAPILQSFIGNVITGTSYVNGGVGLALDAESSAAPFSPRIKRARSNQFVGNDNGVKITGTAGLSGDAVLPQNDFGTPTDLGKNVFRCNAGAETQANGYDFFVATKATGPAQTFRLAGNSWDRAVPWQTTASSDVNGADIVLAGSPATTVDVTGSTVSNVACPAGRVSGQILDNTDFAFNTSEPAWTELAAGGAKYGTNVATAAADSGGTATWSFTGLRPGKYRVAVTWAVRNDFATAAPFTILDNSRVLANVTVNERVAPQVSSGAGISERGVNWQYLGEAVTTTSTNLVVRVGTTAAGGLVVADAVRLEKVAP